MTVGKLVLRNLRYFRGVSLAVVAGTAVATAVLSGALMVGDSVRASLVDLAVQRLGKIDYAIISNRFFDASLADRIGSDPDIKARFEIAPALIVRGAAALDSGTARAAGIQIIGVGGDWTSTRAGSAIINSAAAESLNIRSTGQDIVLSIPSESDIPANAPLARRSRQDTLSGLRARVSSIASEPGMLSLFSPTGGQRTPMNVWVNLLDLQDAASQRGRANAMFVHAQNVADGSLEHLNGALRRVVTLADYDLAFASVANGTERALTSRSTYLASPIERAADRVAAASGIPLRGISVNLINSVNRLESDGRIGSSIHYAVAAGITPLDDAPLADDEIAINAWAAERLSARVGDRLSLSFYARQSDGGLTEVTDAQRGSSNGFRVARILPMSGIGADPSLTPTYKGLTDSDSIANWNPPAEVKIDKTLVTPADEAYWRQYKAAPKLFVSFSTARRLWGTALGDATSIRVPANRADEFANKLLKEIDSATMGLAFRALRQEQIAAASGTTDFGQLFIGFSFFIIVAAALLVAMLMRLNVEQRARQIGAMSALGFSPASLKRMMLLEGMALAAAGGVLGTALAIAYTWLMIAALRSWWFGAVGTTALQLHVGVVTLVIGFVISEIVAILAILWGVRRVGRASAARLLAGGAEGVQTTANSSGTVARWAGGVGLLIGVAIVIAGAAGMLRQQDAFLIGGTMLLISGLCLVGGFFRPHRAHRSNALISSIPRLAFRNASRHTARAVLCIGLIALAAFALVTVSGMRQGEPTDTAHPRSGAGGFSLMVESDIPLLGNPSTRQGRDLLGFREPSNPIWDGVSFIPMLRRAGQDVSCLNITQSTNPTILAVPPSLVERNAFTFASAPSGESNPWKLLEDSDISAGIPMIADDNTARYNLHIAPGDTLEVLDASGTPRRLRLVATLSGSILQGSLLIGENHFRTLFPAQAGFGVVLVQVGAEDQQQIRHMLSDDLTDYSATVRTTASVLAGYLEVQNTYLSTFELLGALGLMLGTIGLAVVLVRTVIERRAELALLASLGFSSSARALLVLMENATLLVSGLLLGTACALIGIFPVLRQSANELNVGSMALALAAALLIGLGASALAVAWSGAQVTPSDLRRE